MPRRIWTTALLLACATVALGQEAATAPADRSQIEALAEDLERMAGEYIQGKDSAEGLDRRLRQLAYDDKNVGEVVKVACLVRPDPQNLYVANRLLRPLLMAKSATVDAALPALRKFRNGQGSYERLPRYSDKELAALQMPDGKVDPKAAANIRNAQSAKLAKDRRVAMHNEQLAAFETLYARLLLMANNKEADREVLDILKENEDDLALVYTKILDVVREESERMEQARAKWFYDELLAMADELRLERKDYLQVDKIKLEPTANSVMATQKDYAGIRLYKAVNVVATLGRCPALKVPTEKQIDDEIRRKQPKPPATRPVRPRGRGN